MTDGILHLKKGLASKAAPSHASDGKSNARTHFKKHSSGVRSKASAPRPEHETIGAAPRAVAALCVRAVEHGQSLSDVLPRLTADLDPRDAALATEIIYGTLRHRRLLSVPLQSLLEHSIPERFDVARAIILCALYQLIYTRVPARAAVACAAGACRLAHCSNMTGLVNAVLRNFLRKGGKLPDFSTVSDAVRYSVPDWFYGKLSDQYDERQLRSILENENEHAPMWLRVENSRVRTADYLKMLDDADISAKASGICESAIMLDEPCDVNSLPGFADGLVSVQDLSAQLAAPLLELEGGMKVLDCCAAPGGKSAHLLDLCNTIDLICLDIDENRVERMRTNFSRLGRNPRSMIADFATDDGSRSAGKDYDRILLDAPCSGSGVIRRHPDIKWLRREKDITSLELTQSALLDNAFDALKKGGILLYTTCSILRDENICQAEEFLKRHPDASGLPFEMGGKKDFKHQRLPGEDGGDGFFYARFIKD